MSLNKTLKLLFFYNAIFCFAAGLLGPLYAVFVAEIDDKITWVGISWFVSLITTTIIVYILSRIGDRFNPKHLLILGYLFRACAWFLFLFVTNIPLLIFTMVLVGFGEAFGTPAFNTVVAKNLDTGNHIEEYSNWTLVNNIAIAFSALIGAFIVDKFGFEPLFIIMAILALASSVGIILNGKMFEFKKSMLK